MAPITKTTTKVMLLAVAVTGLVFTGLTSTTAHDAPENVDDHALSRTFPDLTAGVRTVVCSETVANELGFGEPKDPNEPECSENNPNWLFALNSGGGTSSGFYYDELRVRTVFPEECPDVGGIDDELFKAGNRCETDISQSALLGVGNPNDWYASAKDGDTAWTLGLCADPDFVNLVSPGAFVLDEADAISDCNDTDDWSGGSTLDATDLLIDFGPNSVGTGFFRPTIEQVWDEAGTPSGNHYLGSCLEINQVVEVVLGGANVVHEDNTPGAEDDSFITSHDWFYVVDNDLAAAQNSVLYTLAGSDTQALDRYAGGLC